MTKREIGLVAAMVLLGASTSALAQGNSGGANMIIRDNQTASDPGLAASGGIGTMRGTDLPTQDRGSGSRFEASPSPGPIDPSNMNGGPRPGITPSR